jgi:CMP-N-acetylneuraminic acid synthetase
MRVLAVIPARGGSKGVPRKNIALLGGRPLIAYTIDAALAVGDLLIEVLVSTDDEEIAEVARVAGANVPFLRPAELAVDTARSVDVVRHAVDFVEARDGTRLDWVLTLQPTAPFRSPADIEAAVALAGSDPDADSVISVVEVIDSHPVFVKKLVDGYIEPFCVEEVEGVRRQEIEPPAYKRNGAIYVTRRELLESGQLRGQRQRAYVMPVERSINIDAPLDLIVAEAMLAVR